MTCNRYLISPCIALCRIDTDGYCEGCRRTRTEIASWRSYTDNERKAIMESLHQRTTTNV